MNQIQLAVKLDQLIQAGPTVFLRLNPEVVDFTVDPSFDLVFLSKTEEFEIEINNENFMEVLSLVKAALFENSKLSIIGWNLKNLFTYVLSKTGAGLEFESKILDLKLAEHFIGIRDKAPAKFDDMVKRLRVVVNDSSWARFRNVYQKVYQPLITAVIPKIEIEGVFNTEKRKILFPYYEIKGGRLACQIAYDNCFNPHSLSDEEKSKLQPKGNDLTFLCFDYHFHEVCILAWLSKDANLNKLVFEEGDFYRKLYSLVTGNECESDENRAFCKDCLFLPVIYGQSIKTLSARAGITFAAAEKLVNSLHEVFPQLFTWIANHTPENGVYVDYIGRKKRFVEGEEYKYRNFIVQSPGAIFCLDRLVHLSDKLDNYGGVVAHIHDGYIVRCSEKQTEMVRNICMKVLEGESDLFPGLKLRINCKISKTLA